MGVAQLPHPSHGQDARVTGTHLGHVRRARSALRVGLVALLAFGAAAYLAALAPRVASAQATRGDATPASRDVAPPSALPTPPAGVRFETVDVFVDPGGRPLAAYQFTLRATAGDALLVGLEGGGPADAGGHPAFAAAPYYDTHALLDERVVVAALSASDDLPHGKTRVARLHVQVTGDAEAKYDVKLHVAAGPDGTPVPATVTVRAARAAVPAAAS